MEEDMSAGVGKVVAGHFKIKYLLCRKPLPFRFRAPLPLADLP
jgi:hypothetical protein